MLRGSGGATARKRRSQSFAQDDCPHQVVVVIEQSLPWGGTFRRRSQRRPQSHRLQGDQFLFLPLEVALRRLAQHGRPARLRLPGHRACGGSSCRRWCLGRRRGLLERVNTRRTVFESHCCPLEEPEDRPQHPEEGDQKENNDLKFHRYLSSARFKIVSAIFMAISACFKSTITFWADIRPAQVQAVNYVLDLEVEVLVVAHKSLRANTRFAPYT